MVHEFDIHTVMGVIGQSSVRVYSIDENCYSIDVKNTVFLLLTIVLLVCKFQKNTTSFLLKFHRKTKLQH